MPVPAAALASPSPAHPNPTAGAPPRTNNAARVVNNHPGGIV